MNNRQTIPTILERFFEPLTQKIEIPEVLLHKIKPLLDKAYVVVLDQEKAQQGNVVVCRGLKVGTKKKLEQFIKYSFID